MTEADFKHWLSTAMPGAIITYAEGASLSKFDADYETRRLARLALAAFYGGVVDAVQKRPRLPQHGLGAFRYLCHQTPVGYAARSARLASPAGVGGMTEKGN